MSDYTPPSRETIYSALFALLETATIGGNPAFVTTYRSVKSWDQIALWDKPAMLQLQGEESWKQNASGLPYVSDALVEVYLFAAQADDNVLIAPQLNALVDATIASLKPSTPFGKQTLNGLVENVLLRGKAEYFLGLTGVIGGFAVIPIVLIMPNLQLSN